MPQSKKLTKLLSLREMREQRCLGKIAQARTKKRSSEDALTKAHHTHKSVVKRADARNRAVLTQARDGDQASMTLARFAMSRARGERQIDDSLGQIENRRGDVAAAAQAVDTAAAEHAESQRDLERITALLKEARRSQVSAEEQAEEDEISELFNAAQSGKRRHV